MQNHSSETSLAHKHTVSILQGVSLAALIATIPFLLINIDILHRLIPAGADHAQALVIVSNSMGFLRACCVSALITALMALFVCLFKPSVRFSSPILVVSAACSFLFAQVVIAVYLPYETLDSWGEIALGLILGFGAVVLMLTWAQCLTRTNFHQMLKLCLFALVAACVFDAALIWSSPLGASILRLMVSVVAIISTVVLYRMSSPLSESDISGDNWWDVFGVVDVSLIDKPRNFSTRQSRVAFFVATPLMVLLLIAGAMDMHHSLFADDVPIELIATLVTCVFIVALLVIRVDADTLQASYHMLLPVVGIIIFVVGNFIAHDFHGIFMDLGALILAMLYATLITSLIATMASRMASLRLPAMCLVLLGLSSATLLSYMHVDVAIFGPYKLQVMMVILAIVVALLVATPAARVWSLAFADTEELAKALGVDPQSSYEDRCRKISEHYNLTPREAETLLYLGKGHGSAYIAKEFVVAESTVRSHTKSIYRKLDVNSREELLHLIESFAD